MKAISKKAARQLDAILKYEGIQNVEDHAKVDNAPGAFMALSIEAIGSWEYTSEEPYPKGCDALEISLCHYGKANGDAMRDPEVCILRLKAGGEYQYYPYYYRNDYIPSDYKEKVYRTPTKALTDKKGQADLAHFCNIWMENIIQQQYGGKTPKGESSSALVRRMEREKEEHEEETRLQKMASQIDYEALGQKIMEEIDEGKRQPVLITSQKKEEEVTRKRPTRQRSPKPQNLLKNASEFHPARVSRYNGGLRLR